MDLTVELRRIVDALDQADTAYALAGGLAVSVYTAPRATEDIDLFLAREDLPRAIAALLPLGFKVAGAPMRVAQGRLEIQCLLKIEGRDLLPVDLLVPIDPALAELTRDRVSMPWEGRQIVIVGRASLRTLKGLRGSGQDRVDLEALGPDLG